MEMRSSERDEEEYLNYLRHERHMFAWCLETYGGFSREEAKEAAKKEYPYRPLTDEYWWLPFHDEA